MFLSGRRAIGKVESVILDEISLAQAHHYVLLHYEKIPDYRSYIEERSFKRFVDCAEIMAKLKRLRKIVEDNNSKLVKMMLQHFSRLNSLQAASKPTSLHMEFLTI
uniref:Uncharacterized protein n=1 Tax=Ananas comosus var. bracteatus TaxID=296719 RepID=A0A6V7Q5P7_ANACO|nr:unnamed protein product [Ananas comosus var. bracteatus]